MIIDPMYQKQTENAIVVFFIEEILCDLVDAKSLIFDATFPQFEKSLYYQTFYVLAVKEVDGQIFTSIPFLAVMTNKSEGSYMNIFSFISQKMREKGLGGIKCHTALSDGERAIINTLEGRY